jgi:hypothetical protein
MINTHFIYKSAGVYSAEVSPFFNVIHESLGKNPLGALLKDSPRSNKIF